MARGEDPKDFQPLHCDLLAWLRPEDAPSRVLVETLAEAWWEKMRRIRHWVGATAPDCQEIDRRIDDLLQRFVWAINRLHRKWYHRLTSMLGAGLFGPTVMRKRIEARVALLGGNPRAGYCVPRPGDNPLQDLEYSLAAFAEAMRARAAKGAGAAGSERSAGSARPEN